MSAEEARRWADLGATPPKPPRTGLENREPAGPDDETPEEFFARVAEARLRAENAE